jgi:hypothetical protein
MAAVVLTASVSGVLYGQEGLRDRDPQLTATRSIVSDLQTSTFHHGPFYLLSRFRISDIGYDQQFFTASGGSNSLRLGIAAPQRLYFVPSKKVILSTEVIPSYAFLSRNGLANQFGYTVRGDAQFLLNHLYLDVFGVTSDDIRPDTAEINSPLTLKEKKYGVNGELKYSSRTSMLFSAIRREARYPLSRAQPVGKAVDLLDRDENNYRLALLHKTFGQTSLTLAGERSDYDFRRTTYRNGSRTYVAPGFLYDSGRTTIKGEAGPARLRFTQPGQKEFKGVLGTLGVGQKLAARTSLTASAARDLDFSLFANNNYYILDRAGAIVTYAATRRITLNAQQQFGRDLYEVPVNGILRRDRITYSAVGWLYSRRHFSGGFDVGHFKRTSNDPLGDREDGIRLVLHLSLTP